MAGGLAIRLDKAARPTVRRASRVFSRQAWERSELTPITQVLHIPRIQDHGHVVGSPSSICPHCQQGCGSHEPPCHMHIPWGCLRYPFPDSCAHGFEGMTVAVGPSVGLPLVQHPRQFGLQQGRSFHHDLPSRGVTRRCFVVTVRAVSSRAVPIVTRGAATSGTCWWTGLGAMRLRIVLIPVEVRQYAKNCLRL